ncbi:MAG: hypothetical protein ACR2J5_14915 [Geodermatophilaceae bacterium]
MTGATDEPTSARGLADILREAGISAAGGGGRRRRRDEAYPAQDEDTATIEPAVLDRAEPAQPAYAHEDVPPADPTGIDVGGLSSYFRSRSEPTSEPPDLAPPDILPTLLPPPRTDTGPVPTAGWSSRGTGWPESSWPTSTDPAAESPSITTGSGPAFRSEESTASSGTSHANRSPSPVATTAPDEKDEIDAAPPLRGGVASWAILAVELLAALGLGVAAWYAFSAVWELLPYVAAFAGPLVVTGLVAVAGALRARTGRKPLGLPTLCILVFAGTVLVVLPAATVIVP